MLLHRLCWKHRAPKNLGFHIHSYINVDTDINVDANIDRKINRSETTQKKYKNYIYIYIYSGRTLEAGATFLSKVKFRVSILGFPVVSMCLVPYQMFFDSFCTKLNVVASYPGAPWGVPRNLLFRSEIQGVPIPDVLSFRLNFWCSIPSVPLSILHKT